jgi:mannose-6-phosphate isomerase-like protein (cupin superfamily)
VSTAVVIPRGGGELVGDTPERRVEIVSDHESLSATISRFGPHQVGADLHVHHEHHDLFFLLDGELTVRLGVEDEPVAVPAGTLARVPPDVVHGFRNGGDAPMTFLNLHAPGSRFADYLRAMRDGRQFAYDQHPPPAGGGRPVSEAVVGGEEAVADEPGLHVASLARLDAIAVLRTRWDGRTGRPAAERTLGGTVSLLVLAGSLVVRDAAGGHEVVEGGWAQVPPGVPHALAAPGGVEYLELLTPGAAV